jgi:hypothetical protein
LNDVAEWQRGHQLDYLRGFADVFKARHKPLVFGAFGLTKERDIAEALSKGRLLWTGKPPQAVAIAHLTKKPSEQQDFAQRKFTIPADVVLVKSFAALSVGSGKKLFDALTQKAGDTPVMAEIFEEDETAKTAVLNAGLSYVATKISAGSEVKGIYTDGEVWRDHPLPPEDEVTLEVLDDKFLSAAEQKAINAEIDAYGEDKFAQHYSDYNKRKSWTAIALRGYSDDPADIVKPNEMHQAWKDEHPERLKDKPRWTPAAERFKTTKTIITRLGVEFDRVRFMRLRHKDGELSRHADITDRAAGTADGFVCRLHVPVRTSPAVVFNGWTARGQKIERTLPQGALCYLDQRKPHAVKNSDPTLDRIHLVMDCLANDKLRSRIAKAA